MVGNGSQLLHLAPVVVEVVGIPTTSRRWGWGVLGSGPTVGGPLLTYRGRHGLRDLPPDATEAVRSFGFRGRVVPQVRKDVGASVEFKV